MVVFYSFVGVNHSRVLLKVAAITGLSVLNSLRFYTSFIQIDLLLGRKTTRLCKENGPSLG